MQRPDDFDDDRLTLAGLFVESFKGMAASMEKRLGDDAGLSLQWFELLIRLARSPGHRLRMTDLASQTNLTPSGLTRAVDRLCEAELVQRVACPEDRRVAYAALTGAGLERIRGALGDHLVQVDEVFSVFTPAERDTLAGLLRRLRDHVNPSAGVVTAPETGPAAAPEPA